MIKFPQLFYAAILPPPVYESSSWTSKMAYESSHSRCYVSLNGAPRTSVSQSVSGRDRPTAALFLFCRFNDLRRTSASIIRHQAMLEVSRHTFQSPPRGQTFRHGFVAKSVVSTSTCRPKFRSQPVSGLKIFLSVSGVWFRFRSGSSSGKFALT